jgi:hypothetical protein
VSCEIIKGDKGLGIGFGAVNQYKKSCVAKYKELTTQVFNVALSFKSFLVTKAV